LTTPAPAVMTTRAAIAATPSPVALEQTGGLAKEPAVWRRGRTACPVLPPIMGSCITAEVLRGCGAGQRAALLRLYKVKSFSRFGNGGGLALSTAIIGGDSARRGGRQKTRGIDDSKPLLMGALSIGVDHFAIAGCGGASNASTPTPSTGGLTLAEHSRA